MRSPALEFAAASGVGKSPAGLPREWTQDVSPLAVPNLQILPKYCSVLVHLLNRSFGRESRCGFMVVPAPVPCSAPFLLMAPIPVYLFFGDGGVRSPPALGAALALGVFVMCR